MREKVAHLLEPEFEIVGAVGDGRALIEAVGQCCPDVCVVDISMPILGGIEATRELINSGSNSKFVFLTVYEDPDFLQAAMDAGAAGYVIKSRIAVDLIPAISGAMEGRFLGPPWFKGFNSHAAKRPTNRSDKPGRS